MTWGKMDDKFHRNRKVRELVRMKGGREALGTWTFWWSWCLDDPDLTGVVPDFELDATDRRSAKLLVQVGLWDEVEGGFGFHDFTEYNPTREQREAKKEADRTRVASKRSASRENVARDNSATPPRVASESPPARVPVPTRPDPDPAESPRAHAREATAAPSPGMDSMLRSLTPTPDRDASVVDAVSRARQAAGGGRFKPVGHADRDAVSRLGEWSAAMPPGDLDRVLTAFFAAKGSGARLSWLVEEDPGRYLGAPGIAPQKPGAFRPCPPASEFHDDDSDLVRWETKGATA